jgi:FkbM family methyltransferase
MEQINIQYNNNNYLFSYYKNDASGLGCIYEIITNNEYKLDKFTHINNSFFIDIGANCGLVTIILAKQNPNSIILSYEPHYETFQLLKNNVTINNLSNVKIFNMAVSDNDTKSIVLTTTPGYSGGNTTYADIDKFKTQFYNDTSIKNIDVQCTSLDNIIKDNNIYIIHLLKIDCEGAEYNIIYSSEMFKHNIIKNIVGEFHSLEYNIVDNNINKLIEYCKLYINGLIQITKLTCIDGKFILI